MPSLVTSVIGGIQGASAAHNAGDTAAGGYDAAGKTVQGAATNANNTIGAATTAGQAGVTGAAASGAAGATTAAGTANAGLQPYETTGSTAATTLGGMMAPGGDLTHGFNQDVSQDPGYQFRLQQGDQALDRSAAAGGTVMGGGQLKALTNYSQGVASQEYNNAFNRFQTDRQNRFNDLSGLADSGQRAATTAGGNTINAAQYGGTLGMLGATTAGAYGMQGAGEEAGNTMKAGEYQGDTQIGAAGAKAQGIMGAANSWNGMLSGIGGTLNAAVTGGMAGGGWSNLGALKGAVGG